MDCFIIAEAGVNHNGDINLAKELVYAASEAGANAIKFQTCRAEALVTKTAAKAKYQQNNTNNSCTQFEMLSQLELSEDAHYQLKNLADSLSIEFMSTGFDHNSVDFLVQLGVSRLKIPSGEVTNISYLRHVAQTGLPLIMSTGMCDLQEVEIALRTIAPFYNDNLQNNVILLHCTSNYPVAPCDVNLRAMETLRNKFNLSVGYSDHTLGNLVPTLAVGLGACVIEKHFTLDKKLAGPDHQASMTPFEMQQMVQAIRETELILGSSAKTPTEAELPIRSLVRRSVTLRRSVLQGIPITLEDLALLRPGHGIAPSELENIVGKKLKRNLPADTTLLWDHLEL
jgi:N,N'-diacetyllegionaminate synthase